MKNFYKVAIFCLILSLVACISSEDKEFELITPVIKEVLNK